MRRILLYCAFSLFSWSTYAQDYSAVKLPALPDPLPICKGTTLNIAYLVNDLGFNLSATDYTVTSSNPAELAINPISAIPLNGTIPNLNVAVIPVAVTMAPTASGIYQVELVLSCASCGDPDVVSTFNIIANEIPDVTIEAVPGALICDATNVSLTTTIENEATNLAYLWNTGSIATSIIAGVSGSYSVTVANECGVGNASIEVMEESTPSIISQICLNIGNDLITTVTAVDDDLLGIDFEWLENGVPIVSGGDYDIVTIGNVSTLTVSNVTQLSIFSAEAYNECGFDASSGCLAVPVELTYFNAQPMEEGVLLKWETETETNNDYFTLERSTDGRVFQPITNIPGAGTSLEPLSYQFLDRELPLSADGSLYYRLLQTDFDGSQSYSEVVQVKMEILNNFELTRWNWSDEQLLIQYYMPQDEQLTFTLFDLGGRQLFQETFSAQKGFAARSLSLESLSNGMYILQAATNGQIVSEKVVK